MDFNYSEEQNLLANAAKEFAEQYIRPHIMEWDESQHFPADVLHKAGEMGFMGVFIPEKYGGSGFGYHEYIAIIEEISKAGIKNSETPIKIIKIDAFSIFDRKR